MKLFYLFILVFYYSCDPRDFHEKINGSEEVKVNFQLVPTDQIYFSRKHSPPICIDGVLQEEYIDPTLVRGPTCEDRLVLRPDGTFEAIFGHFMMRGRYQIREDILYTDLDTTVAEKELQPSFIIIDQHTLKTVSEHQGRLFLKE
jgi:hypothetical protein